MNGESNLNGKQQNNVKGKSYTRYMQTQGHQAMARLIKKRDSRSKDTAILNGEKGMQRIRSYRVRSAGEWRRGVSIVV